MGKLLYNAHDSRHLSAGLLLSEHHIFMQTLSKLRFVKTGCSDARCFAASPFGLCCHASVSSFSFVFGQQFFHEFHLNLLNLEESLPLVDDEVVQLLVQMADF